MTTEYHDAEEDSNSFWNNEPRPVSLSAVSRLRRWLFPALTVTVVLVVIIALGANNTAASRRLWSLEQRVSNLTGSVEAVQLKTEGAAKDVHWIKFAVEDNKGQLISVSEALKQLSTLDSLEKTVASLKCSLERLINNGSQGGRCCPLGWTSFGSSCYMFSNLPSTWYDARDNCNGQEAHLVVLSTEEEWDFVIRQATGTFFWVGLTDERTGQWEWVNQTPYVMNRRRWRPGQPDSWTHHGLGPGDEDCAHIHNDGRLNDLHCSTRLRFICQRHS